MAFERLAERKNAKLRLALSGTAGAGKTWNALWLAGVFGKRVGVIDSERGSSEKYAGEPGMPRFYVEHLQDKGPQEYQLKIREAADAGIDALVIDSYSHSWIRALETVDAMGGSKFSNGWRIVSPQVNKLVDVIQSYPGHVIATMRSKADFVLEENAKGKQEPKKVGMASVAREGTDFEFDIVIDLTPEGVCKVTKSRAGHRLPPLTVFERGDFPRIAKTLRGWLDEGAPLSPRDAFADRLRFALDLAALDAVVREVRAAKESGAMSAEDAAALVPIYQARKAELLAADPEGVLA